MDLEESLAHYVLEGDGFGADEVGGPEAEDAVPVFVGELGGRWLVTVGGDYIWVSGTY